jgi:ABC-type branched-subunit amino acid transport system ATPase component
MTGSLLTLDDVKVHFGGVKAVDGITLNLEPGKLYGIVGPNGSGKTTLINAVSRFVPLTAGTIAFDGTQVSDMRPFEVSRHGVGRTFQAIRLLPTLTVRENVLMSVDRMRARGSASGALWRRSRADRKHAEEAADAALERLHLTRIAGEYPDNLPYGTRRRIEIARAIATRPKLLMLDEPIAGMNREERTEIAEVMKSLRDDGLTQLLIEHDLRIVLSTCDHIFVMNFGKKVAEGPPRETAALPVVQEAYLGRKHDGDA